jgi:hypothetical protein
MSLIMLQATFLIPISEPMLVNFFPTICPSNFLFLHILKIYKVVFRIYGVCMVYFLKQNYPFDLCKGEVWCFLFEVRTKFLNII